MPDRPNSKAEIDRASLHYILWTRAHPKSRIVTFVQARLAREFRVTRFTMNRTIQQMIREGRLEPKGDNDYLVNDPIDWLEWPDGAAEQGEPAPTE